VEDEAHLARTEIEVALPVTDEMGHFVGEPPGSEDCGKEQDNDANE
jgi:hypothetical protein